MNYSYVTIPNGTAITGEIDLRTWRLLGIKFPAAWTAADITFQVSEKPTAEGGVYAEVFNTDDSGTGAALVWDAAASIYSLPDWAAAALQHCMLKVRSGTSGAPVNQGADRILTLILGSTP